MESPESPVVIYITHAIVTDVGKQDNMSWFITNKTATKWLSVGDCAFIEGDRVKITITKEPINATQVQA